MNIETKTIEKDEKYLRRISQEIDMEKEDYQSYINKLETYCTKNEVFAMAAVQIGIPKRIIYLKNTKEEKIGDKTHNERQILINPEIISRKGHTEYWEACASCLDNFGLVDRPYELTIKYFDENREPQTKTFQGFETTVLSHELDHLDGILHIDIAKELYQMDREQRKEFRKTHPYKIISKTCPFPKKS